MNGPTAPNERNKVPPPYPWWRLFSFSSFNPLVGSRNLTLRNIDTVEETHDDDVKKPPKETKRKPESDIVTKVRERRKNETILRIFLPALQCLKKVSVALLPLATLRLQLDEGSKKSKEKYVESLLVDDKTAAPEKRRKGNWKS